MTKHIITKYLDIIQNRIFLKEAPSEMYITGSNQMYHGSITQNLKKITARMDPALNKPVVWGSYYRPFAATFVIPYRDARIVGHRCGGSHLDHCLYWILEVTKATKKYLRKPCSLYTIKPIGDPKSKKAIWDYPKNNIYAAKDKSIITIGKDAPGVYVSVDCEVVKEVKYRSVLECYMKNMVAIVYVE